MNKISIKPYVSIFIFSLIIVMYNYFLNTPYTDEAGLSFGLEKITLLFFVILFLLFTLYYFFINKFLKFRIENYYILTMYYLGEAVHGLRKMRW